MFCAFDFAYAKIPVAVHSIWNDQNTRCELNMFTTRRDAEVFLRSAPAEGSNELRNTLSSLREDRLYGSSQKFSGNVAITFTAMIVIMRNHSVTSVSLDCNLPDYMGFYDPPENKQAAEGIALWYHPDEGYRVAIMHSKEQGKELLKGWTWVDEQRLVRLHQRVRKWNVHPRSQTLVTTYEGVIAELLCKGALASKVDNALAGRRPN